MTTTLHPYTRKVSVWRGIGRALMFVGLFAGSQVLLSMLVPIVMMIDQGRVDEQAIFSCQSLIVAVADLFGLVIALLIVYLCRGDVLSETALTPPTGVKPIVQSVLLGAGLCGVVSILLATIPFPETWMDAYVESSEAVAGGMTWLDLTATVLIAPIVEEVMIRGLAYRALKEGMPTVVAALISSVVFGLLHGTIVWVFYTFLMGMVCVALLEYTGTLWAPIALHMAFNIVGQLPVLMEEASDLAVGIYYYGLSTVFVLAAVWIVVDRNRKNRKQPM